MDHGEVGVQRGSRRSRAEGAGGADRGVGVAQAVDGLGVGGGGGLATGGRGHRGERLVEVERRREVVEGLCRAAQVAEGVNTVKLVRDKAQELGVYMPLANGLYKIIYEKDSMDNIISSLMLSEQALDVEFAANENKVLD